MMDAVTDDTTPDGDGSTPPWGWSAVRERPTGEQPQRVLPSAVGAEMTAGLGPPVVPGPAPGVEGAAVRRDRRTTWGLRVAGLAFLALAGGGLLSTDIGAGLRDDVLAQLPDLLVPGSGSEPDEPTDGPEAEPAPAEAADAPQPQPAAVVPGTLLTPSVPSSGPSTDPGAEGPGTPDPPVDPPTEPPVDPGPPSPPPTRPGTVSSLLDPVVSGVAGLADDVTGGTTNPVMDVVVPATDGITDVLDGVVDPVLDLLGGVATGR
ncbi:hypothetical protein NOK12_07330 [Nocardioides sp. OK12]|nr:hypothetical protein NOK12_07330 [Nocardioides sp. OK12]